VNVPIPPAPAVQAPAPIAAPAVPAAPAPDLAKAEIDSYEIHIPNDNGSFMLITLKKTDKGFIGPQGEFYSDHPTVEQLKQRYIKK
jgi:hypothetical protein